MSLTKSHFCSRWLLSWPFWGLFGLVSWLVSPSKTVQGELLANEVSCFDSSVALFILRSKTDQLGRGTYLPLYRVRSLHICPVLVVEAFVRVRPQQEGSFLMHLHGLALSKISVCICISALPDRIGFGCSELLLPLLLHRSGY